MVPGGGGGGGDPYGAAADYPLSAGFAPGGAQTLPLLKHKTPGGSILEPPGVLS